MEPVWYLGTMGYSYAQWQGLFYPDGLASRYYLPYYAERFGAVEMDSTFYGTPPLDRVVRWGQMVPEGFQICPKVPRMFTHELDLAVTTADILAFVERMQCLGDNLGVVLLQFSPSFDASQRPKLAHLLRQLPTEVRFAVEFRHRSWEGEETAVLLAKHNICWCATDYIHLEKRIHRTTDFLYLRFIGPHGQFATKDRELIDKTDDLVAWWQQIVPMQQDIKRIYGFFNNDYAGYSPATCNRFKRIVGLPESSIQIWQQARLF